MLRRFRSRGANRLARKLSRIKLELSTSLGSHLRAHLWPIGAIEAHIRSNMRTWRRVVV